MPRTVRGALTPSYWKRHAMMGCNVSDNDGPPLSCPVCALRAAPAWTKGEIQVCQNCGVAVTGSPLRPASRAQLMALSEPDRAHLEQISATIMRMLRR